MTFKELEALMVKHGAVIRAITENERIFLFMCPLETYGQISAKKLS